MSNDVVTRLLGVAPFGLLDPDAFPESTPLEGILRNDCRINHYADGELIIREGDYGSSAFFLLHGTALVSLKSVPSQLLGRSQQTKKTFFESLSQFWSNSKHPETRNYDPNNENINHTNDKTRVFLQDVPRVIGVESSEPIIPGEFFGELAALNRTPRSATVVSQGESFLLEIRWQGLRDLMRHDEAIRRHIDRLYRENSLNAHLRETPLLKNLPAASIEKIAKNTILETFGNFDWQNQFKAELKKPARDRIESEPIVAERGEYAEDLILIRNGFGRLSRPNGNGQQTIAYLGKGEMFGLRELTHNWRTGEQRPWNMSLRAVGYLDILRIPGFVVEEEILPNVPSSFLPSNYVESSATQVSGNSRQNKRSNGVKPELLEFLMDHRFINGKQAMMIDLNRCTRCDDCVRACAATHDNNPRFVRQGPKHDQFMIAGACMHCVDPVCMIGCPTGAIGRDETTGSVVINDKTCVGCGTCANSCPYENIRMVHVRDKKGQPIVDRVSGEPIAKATKCDLCVEQNGGPACQNACPHDALVRIDLSNTADLTAWLTGSPPVPS